MRSWPPRIDSEAHGPKYLRLAASIRDAIATGALPPGSRLPSHRDLSYQLGIAVASVARAYRKLSAEGLVRSAVGRGTIVTAPAERSGIALERAAGLIDLTLARPPSIPDRELADRAGRRSLMTIGSQWALLQLGDTLHEGGDVRHRQVAADWLVKRGVPATPASVAITTGEQEALAAALMTLTSPGDTVLAECWTISACRELIERLGLHCVPVALDADGICPDDLARKAQRRRVRAALVQPTLQCPTGCSMSEARRREIAEAARRADIVLIEYEGWFPILGLDVTPLAALAPERVVHVDAFSNALMPGLRAAIVHLPDEMARRFAETRRALVLSGPRLIAEIAAHWIVAGIAEALAGAIGQVNAGRMAAARRVLGARIAPAPAQTPFLWLDASGAGGGGTLTEAARRGGVAVLPATRFSTGATAADDHVRVALSSAGSDAEADAALRVLAALV